MAAARETVSFSGSWRTAFPDAGVLDLVEGFARTTEVSDGERAFAALDRVALAWDFSFVAGFSMAFPGFPFWDSEAFTFLS
jgi:hypothetical protein